jgi:anti-sigma factor RsiW
VKHQMNEEDWFAYLDDLTSAKESSSIATHLQSCATCRETVELMHAVDKTLLHAGARLRKTVPVPSAAISAAKEKALARLGNHTLSLRLGSLYLLLAPMCGMETSTRAICAAAHRVSADSPQFLEERSWPGFVEHLHTIVATLCGEPAAELVRERGLRLQQEAA